MTYQHDYQTNRVKTIVNKIMYQALRHGYTPEQQAVIEAALDERVNIYYLMDPSYSPETMQEVCQWVKSGWDPRGLLESQPNNHVFLADYRRAIDDALDFEHTADMPLDEFYWRLTLARYAQAEDIDFSSIDSVAEIAVVLNDPEVGMDKTHIAQQLKITDESLEALIEFSRSGGKLRDLVQDLTEQGKSLRDLSAEEQRDLFITSAQTSDQLTESLSELGHDLVT